MCTCAFRSTRFYLFNFIYLIPTDITVRLDSKFTSFILLYILYIIYIYMLVDCVSSTSITTQSQTHILISN